MPKHPSIINPPIFLDCLVMPFFSSYRNAGGRVVVVVVMGGGGVIQQVDSDAE